MNTTARVTADPTRGLDKWEIVCPNVAKHTRHPLGYVAWHEWAADKAKTHRQVGCSGCDRLAIWVPDR